MISADMAFDDFYYKKKKDGPTLINFPLKGSF